jgi:tetratricopeptide (TPR) repeat protein
MRSTSSVNRLAAAYRRYAAEAQLNCQRVDSGGLFSPFMASRPQNPWLFGSIPDLFLGAGLLYLLVVSGLLVWGTSAQEVVPAALMSYLVLSISGSHYGGTLVRVYEHGPERRTYRLFTVYGTVGMILVLLGALYSPLAGSILITVYLTWSPWHYTGQNYGIALMFLRRRGVEIPPLAKRMLHTSFVLSFAAVFLTMHVEGNSGQVDPLGFSSLELDTFQFISIGLSSALRNLVVPILGLGYLASIAIAATLLVRSGGFRSFAPTALIMLTQAVWFSIPYFGSSFDLAARYPALGAIEGETYKFYFVWVALGHSVQYLWITAYYARGDKRWSGYGRYFAKVFVFGNAVWAAPVLLFGPDLLGRPDFDFGLAMCVAAAVNLHHFMLDGAIWRLRNPKLAAVLLRSNPQSVQTAEADGDEFEVDTSVWARRIAWSLAGLFCLARIVPYVELDQRLPAALVEKDYSTAESILDRAALYGRDSTILRIRLAKELVKTQTPARSLRHYRRSLDLYAHAEGYVEYGRLTERFQDLDRAIVAWELGIPYFPDDVELVRHLGIGLLRAGRAPEAIPYLERAIEIEPEDETTRRALAKAKMQGRRH